MSNSTNGTSIGTSSGSDLFLLTYSALLVMALLPIYFGSHMSLSRRDKQKASGTKPDERMTTKDAYMFPVVGSCVLLGLYVLFRLFSKEYVNMLLTAYFLFFGFFSLFETLEPLSYLIAKRVSHSLVDGPPAAFFSFRLPWEKDITNVNLKWSDIGSGILAALVLLWYTLTKNWIANNLLGLAFSLQGVAMIPLSSYKVGCILLGGLFFYDIFWVFGTDVMVTVAKSFDAPIKLLFPKNILASTYQFSMLGLGDIVIPGIFVALLLRYDAHRAKKSNKASSSSYSTPFFNATFLGYIVGLVTTIVVMHTFQAAQPALLYLVPACIGFSSLTAVAFGELQELIAFEEEEEEKKNQ